MTLLTTLFGQNTAQSLTGGYASQQGIANSQAGQLAAQNYYNAQAQYAQQQAHQNWVAAQQLASTFNMPSQHRYNPAKWMYDGEVLSLTAFADKVFGDTPQKTMFILKHSEEK